MFLICIFNIFCIFCVGEGARVIERGVQYIQKRRAHFSGLLSRLCSPYNALCIPYRSGRLFFLVVCVCLCYECNVSCRCVYLYIVSTVYEETFVLTHLTAMIVPIVFIRYCVYCYYFRPGVCDPGATLDL